MGTILSAQCGAVVQENGGDYRHVEWKNERVLGGNAVTESVLIFLRYITDHDPKACHAVWSFVRRDTPLT